MRKPSIALLLAAAALVPMLMAPSGGFPSRPTFQTAKFVTSSNAADFVNYCATGQASGSRCWNLRLGGGAEMGLFTSTDAGVDIAENWYIGRTGLMGIAPSTGTGSGAVTYLTFNDSVGARSGYVGKASSGDSHITIESDGGGVKLASNSGTHQILYDTVGGFMLQSNDAIYFSGGTGGNEGAGTVNAMGGLFDAGRKLPHMGYMQLAETASSCTVTVNPQSAFGATCTRTAVGKVTISPPGFSNLVCFVSPLASTAQVVQNFDGTSLITSYTSGALADIFLAAVVCMGT